ncbi:MAG: MBL fold metallo-hydrolase [Corynebacterium sp.]|nr:MBL fold metallo-hydrolase [Corynebacterium sp.]
MQILGFSAGPYKTNTYVMANDEHAVVVDPGMHTAAKIEEILATRELSLEGIVLTHGHIDHTRDAGDLALKHSVPVYIHPEDAFMLKNGEGVSEQSQVLFDASNMTPISDLRELSADLPLKVLGTSFSVLHCPGHSPGSVIIVGDEFAITGDVLFKGSIGRTDLPQSSPQAMRESLAGPVKTLEDSLALLPGHGPTTTMRSERQTNPFLTGVADVV